MKTQSGYKTATALPEDFAPLPRLTHALREFLQDIRPAENLLVLKTPPSGAQPLAAAVDGAKFPEVAGTIAGDDTVLIITPNKKTRESLQKTHRSAGQVRNPNHIAVIGVTGYTGFELAQILVAPSARWKRPPFICATLMARNVSTNCFRNCADAGTRRCGRFRWKPLPAARQAPHFWPLLTTFQQRWRQLWLKRDSRVVDLSGAFRFRDQETFKNWYKLAAPPAELLAEAVYGIPETIRREN